MARGQWALCGTDGGGGGAGGGSGGGAQVAATHTTEYN